jgi:hypothetical protein
MLAGCNFHCSCNALFILFVAEFFISLLFLY